MPVMDFAKDWIAGSDIEDAIRYAKSQEKLGRKSIITHLGEFIKDPQVVEHTVQVYLDLITLMKSNHVKGSIAVRSTQLGLLQDEQTFYDNYEKIVKAAYNEEIFVWLEMENFEDIEACLKAYTSRMGRYKNIGISIQAKVKRSRADIKTLVQQEATIKLERGYYVGVPGETYENDKNVEDAYIELMQYLFVNSDSFCIASDETKIIEKTISLEKQFGKKTSFSLLMGMAPKTVDKLTDMKQDINIYIPFGNDWLGYMMRRFREEGTMKYFTRALLKDDDDKKTK